MKCCDTDLTTVEDHFGGGSHYWILHCDKCNKFYTFDTYGFKLERVVIVSKEWFDQHYISDE